MVFEVVDRVVRIAGQVSVLKVGERASTQVIAKAQSGLAQTINPHW
jgi:hypothetical protein